MSALRLVILVVLGATSASVAAHAKGPPAHRLASLSFMAGCWSATAADGATAEECWLAPAGGVMLGVHRDVDAKGKVFFEFLRIEQRGERVVYVASPGGGPTTEFVLAKIGTGSAVFTNPQHDFPKRITYRLDGDGALRVVVDDGRDKGKQKAWVWRQAPQGWKAPVDDGRTGR